MFDYKVFTNYNLYNSKLEFCIILQTGGKIGDFNALGILLLYLLLNRRLNQETSTNIGRNKSHSLNIFPLTQDETQKTIN